MMTTSLALYSSSSSSKDDPGQSQYFHAQTGVERCVTPEGPRCKQLLCVINHYSYYYCDLLLMMVILCTVLFSYLFSYDCWCVYE